MKFFFDITPAIINKTAIHNIIKDTIEDISASNDHLLLIGKSYQYSGTFESGMPRLMRLALKFPRLFIFFRRLFIPLLPADNRPIFFFDPLYLLFYKKIKHAKVMILDLTPLTKPQWHNEKVARLYREAFYLLKKLDYECYSISESTRTDLRTILKLTETKNKLLYIYANKKFQPHSEPVFSKRILFVGSFEPRKNLIGLIQGFLKSNLPARGYSLDIVGAATQHYEEVKSEIVNHKSITFHGYLSDADLHSLYRNAQIFAYPSLWEGFGVPLLEAMNTKIACFASETSACPEVGGPSMYYVNPESELEIAKGLEFIASMNREDYKAYTEKNWLHAQRFSFENYVQTLLKELV